jgi:hypothetical protein
MLSHDHGQKFDLFNKATIPKKGIKPDITGNVELIHGGFFLRIDCLDAFIQDVGNRGQTILLTN